MQKTASMHFFERYYQKGKHSREGIKSIPERKKHILFWLWKKEVLRYSELKRSLGNVTHKMLSSQLKELERGLTLMPVLQSLCDWGHQHIDDV
ncbi:MAG: winged helix-turn-helix transcriptional regulator [Lachnospiraceae bacterium]|nr:winged helix-turn-helix transcriptional regulator [Lachnospiraceae bacterium]